ncbi:hypothetical protein B0H16DRAFT_1471537 [Mycena metata]|uniref:Uncharacterized protein n=1 Tax=Mycena metata TaxID=1033252 RepID=A0AAD7HQR7_9AGAR|nr:hypothetical protein B0H16DRAFT_1471537 [Mycena metata]
MVQPNFINPSAAVNGRQRTAHTATARDGVPLTGPVPPVKTATAFIPTRGTGVSTANAAAGAAFPPSPAKLCQAFSGSRCHRQATAFQRTHFGRIQRRTFAGPRSVLVVWLLAM